MANPKGNPSSLRPIQPGETRNPKGGSRKASEKKLLRQLMSKGEAEEIGKLMLEGKLSHLQKIVDDSDPKKGGKQKHSVIKVMFAAQAIAAMKGKTEAFNALFDRLFGRVPTPMQLSSPDGSMRPIVNLLIPENGRSADVASDPEKEGG